MHIPLSGYRFWWPEHRAQAEPGGARNKGGQIILLGSEYEGLRMPWEEIRIYLLGKPRLQQREGNEVLLKSYICKYFFL